MVDLAYPVRALGGQISHLHQYLKNIESYHFGKLYTIAYDDYVDYYIVQGPAKRVFNWIADNQKAAYTIGIGILAAFILYKAHPLRPNVNASTDPNPAKAPDQIEGEEIAGDPAGDEEIHSGNEGDVDGTERPRRRKGAEGSPRKESLEGAEDEKEVATPDAEREVGSDHEEEDGGTTGAKGSAKKPAAPTAAKAAAASKPAASTDAKGAAAALLDSLFTDEDDEASGAEDASKPTPIANPAKAPATPPASAAKAAAVKAPATATPDNKDADPAAQSAAQAKAPAKPSAPAAVPAVNADAK